MLLRRFSVIVIFSCLALILSTTASAVQLTAGFGTGEIVLLPVNGKSPKNFRIARQSSGKLILAYTSEDAVLATHGKVSRLNLDGTLDITFGIGGTADIFVSGNVINTTDLAIGSDDSIFISGSAVTDAFNSFSVLAVKMNLNGILDGTFDGDGIALADADENSKRGTALYVDGTTPYIAGTRAFVGVVYKFTTGGILDTAFDGDGRLDFTGIESMSGITKDPSGKIVATGFDQGVLNAFVGRFSTGGVLDSGFSGDGKFDFPFADFNDTHGRLSVASDASGNLFIAGEGGSNLSAFKVTGAGLLDGSFSGDGQGIIDFAGDNDVTEDVLLDSSGLPVVLGSVRTGGIGDVEFGLVRFTAGGLTDTSFGANGKFGVDFLGFEDNAHDMLLSGSDLFVGGLIAATALENFGSETLIGIAKLDISLGTGGGSDYYVHSKNTGFEQGAGGAGKTALWKGVKLTGNVRVCNKPNKNKFYSFAGNCAFYFKGGKGEKSAITQKISQIGLPVVTAGSVLNYDLMLQASTQVKLTLKVTLNFTAGGKTVLINQKFTTVQPQYGRFIGIGFTVPQDAKAITVSLSSKATKGKAYVDNLILYEASPFFGGARSAGVLPLPAAPSGFRTGK